jgi:hypothetical protein
MVNNPGIDGGNAARALGTALRDLLAQPNSFTGQTNVPTSLEQMAVAFETMGKEIDALRQEVVQLRHALSGALAAGQYQR